MRALASRLAAGALAALSGLALVTQASAHEGAETDAHHEEDEQDGVHGAEGHHEDSGRHDLEDMREMHRGHEHEHDFEAMERLSPEERQRVLALMRNVGLALPPMDPERGRALFLEKGCVTCHQVNGVGGDLGPALNAEDMPEPMNAFEFAARMWRGAPAMTDLQRQMLGDVITLNGQELADIIAFAHDEEAQATLDEGDIPQAYREFIEDQ